MFAPYIGNLLLIFQQAGKASVCSRCACLRSQCFHWCVSNFTRSLLRRSVLKLAAYISSASANVLRKTFSRARQSYFYPMLVVRNQRENSQSAGKALVLARCSPCKTVFHVLQKNKKTSIYEKTRRNEGTE